MSQSDYILDLARYALDNDHEKLIKVLGNLIEHSKQTRKNTLASELLSIVKESEKKNFLGSLKSSSSRSSFDDIEVEDLVLEKIISKYTFNNLVASEKIKEELHYFVEEHNKIDELRKLSLPISNKVMFFGHSGCGKTLASYVLAGELHKTMIVINTGAVISSKLGETSKNLSKIFRRVASENCIIFFDEFDSLGKIRDYDQDHGEMKRVVNTILQLFDYLPQNSVVIAATNQVNMIDNALLRRFDVKLFFDLPNETQIQELINKTLSSGKYIFNNKENAEKAIKSALGLSYYSIQKTLISVIKRGILDRLENTVPLSQIIDTSLWMQLIQNEKEGLNI